MITKLSEELSWRGFVNQTTFKDLGQLDGDPITFYWGVDPSANSMTVGNLAMAMMVRHFIRHGHRAVLLVGGATGMIGDPDGKTDERQLKTLDEISKNKQAIANEYRRIFEGEQFEIVDNYDWFKNISYLQFLRDVGKHFSMTQLLDREFVQSRIGKGGKGISYAEFSYSLIQGYDFLHLSRSHKVTLQLAGADQWGNSIAGVELIRKIDSKEAHIWTGPLIINTATGKKFGKSEEGAVWLCAEKTSPFEFYQFWLNADDTGVETYLKVYTLLERQQIEDVLNEFKSNPAGRAAQKTLAYEVTKLVHGIQLANEAKQATAALAKGEATAAIQSLKIDAGEAKLIDLLVKSGLADSNSQAMRLIKQGGVKINRCRVDSDVVKVQHEDILQVGKRNFVRLIES
ncbi:MAG: tyrosine--tRNA ligase [Candidatus Woesebacteria bacterium]|jgi:tyrosyl-tRNA synthetase